MSLTPDEAIPLLWDNGKDVHNIGVGGVAIGATWGRDDAVKAIQTAKKIIIGDWPNHRLFVVQENGRRSLFETDDGKVAEFLKAHDA